jgi:general stress protein YciG
MNAADAKRREDGRRGGFRAAANMTPEQRSERARRGARASAVSRVVQDAHELSTADLERIRDAVTAALELRGND